MAIKYLFKDTFAVIGKAGQGAADKQCHQAKLVI